MYKHHFRWLLLAACAFFLPQLKAQTTSRVVDIPTRPGVTQRMLVMSPPSPKAMVVLFAGGHGGLQIFPNGTFKWGGGNFLLRVRQLFVDQGMIVAVVDTPSDHQRPPFLQGFRQTAGHVADIKAVITWSRENAKVPVWLVGTSRGTQSAAFVATELSGADGPDGIVLTSTMLSDDIDRPVTAMPLDKIRVPVLVAHHELDGCKHCAYTALPDLMGKLTNTPRKQLLTFNGGITKGDPCEAFAYHGFNGIEAEVVQQITGWILAK